MSIAHWLTQNGLAEIGGLAEALDGEADDIDELGHLTDAQLAEAEEEIAAARPNDDVDLDPDLLEGVIHRAHAGGGAAFEKVLAQLNAGRAALFRRDGRGHRVDANFK